MLRHEERDTSDAMSSPPSNNRFMGAMLALLGATVNYGRGAGQVRNRKSAKAELQTAISPQSSYGCTVSAGKRGGYNSGYLRERSANRHGS